MTQRGGWNNEKTITEQMVRDAWAEHGTLQGVHKGLGVSWDKAVYLVDKYGLNRSEKAAPPEDGPGAMDQADFVALAWTARILSTNWPSRRQAYDAAALTKPCDECGQRIRTGFRCGRCFPAISEAEWEAMLEDAANA
jgi:hypothetical protein